MGSVKITGWEEMRAQIMALPEKLQESVALSALRVGANVVAQEVRRLAPVGRQSSKNRKRGMQPGALRDSVRVTHGVFTDGVARVSVFVGSLKQSKHPVYYARWVEFGTQAHWIKVNDNVRPLKKTRRGDRLVSTRTLNKMAKSGSLKIGENFVGESVAHPGARPKPFMRPAMDAKQKDAMDAIVAHVRKQIARIARKQGTPMKEAA